jgi:NAD(P)-dependent dehydrogenase (short-subunit alcohol dehydrogenase family)
MTTNGVALITGVSSGIGRETARLFANQGWRVFGSVRNIQHADPITNVEFVMMDVSDDQSVKDAVESVLHHADKIDILVNNAGYSIAGGLEETSIDEARQLFETNFFGVLRVTQGVLPSMRRHGYGRIVNISSMAGIVPMPYRGIYAASKHALEAFTEVLDHEVRQFGIRAVVIEPTFTKTSIMANEKIPGTQISAYAEQKRRVEATILKALVGGDEPRAVAEVIYHAATAEHPHLHNPVGEGVTLSRLRRFLPVGMFQSQFRKRFQLDEPARNGGARS